MLNRSRSNLAEYLAYQQEVEQAAARVNERWAHARLAAGGRRHRDDYEQTIAGFTRYDVLLVNPMKDGLNLVAKEGPLVNRRDGVVCCHPRRAPTTSSATPCFPCTRTTSSRARTRCTPRWRCPTTSGRDAPRRLRELVAVHTPRTWLDELLTRSAR